MRKMLMLGLVILAMVVVAGCSRGPAEAALEAANEALAQVQPEAAKFLPAESQALANAVAEARAKFDAGDYQAALASAKDLPAQAAEVANTVAARKNELLARWNGVQSTLPAKVQGFADKINALRVMRKLPKGLDPAQVETAMASLTDVNDLWATANNAFSAGDVVTALAKAADVQARADELATLLDTVVLPTPKKR
jgi:hypothetical protein